MGLSLVNGPTSEPIDLTDAKHQVQQDEAIELDDDHFERFWIPAARKRCEKATGRQLITATWDLFLPRFPCWSILELPKPPLQSVTWVKYVDPAGDLQTWATSNYDVDLRTGTESRGRIRLAYGVSWPSVRCQWNAVQVRFVAGYGNSGDAVDHLLRQAMLLDIGSMFVHRENVIIDPASEVILELPDGSKSVYRSFKSRALYPLPED